MLQFRFAILDPYELFAINETTAEVRNVKTLYVDVPTLTVVVLVRTRSMASPY